jgi:hypothetical protein
MQATRRQRLVGFGACFLAVAFLAALLITGFVPGCVDRIIGHVTEEPISWEFIQSVGGLRVLDPQRQPDGTLLLPVECDVSGLRAVTVKPTAINSGIVVASTEAQVSANRIHLRVIVCAAGAEGASSRAPPARLEALAPGDYVVEYLSPDGALEELATIRIDT